jgi:hypothetical protein
MMSGAQGKRGVEMVDDERDELEERALFAAAARARAPIKLDIGDVLARAEGVKTRLRAPESAETRRLRAESRARTTAMIAAACTVFASAACALLVVRATAPQMGALGSIRADCDAGAPIATALKESAQLDEEAAGACFDSPAAPLASVASVDQALATTSPAGASTCEENEPRVEERMPDQCARSMESCEDVAASQTCGP